MKLATAVENYFGYLKHEVNVTKATWHTYSSNLRNYVKWLEGQDGIGKDPHILAALSTEMLRRYLYAKSGEGLRPRSIQGYFYPIKGLIRHLLDHGALQQDPMTGIKLPAKDDPVRHSVSDAECAAMLAACDRLRSERRRKMARALLSVIVFCGLRASEALNLRVSDLSSESGTLVVVHGKGRKNRTLYPSPETWEALKEWLAVRATTSHPRRPRAVVVGTDYVWAYDANRRLAYAGLSTLVDEVKRIAGLEGRENIHPHALRRGFATRLMQNGATIRAIQAALGHSDPSITFAYLAPDAEPARTMQSLARLTPTPHPIIPDEAPTALSTGQQRDAPVSADKSRRQEGFRSRRLSPRR